MKLNGISYINIYNMKSNGISYINICNMKLNGIYMLALVSLINYIKNMVKKGYI